MVVINYVVLR